MGLNNAFEVKLSCVLVFQSDPMLRTVQLLQKLVHPRPSLLRLSYPCSSDSVQGPAAPVRKKKMATKRTQPAWEAPNPGEIPRLKLYNSLTREKEIFIPQKGKKVKPG